MAWQRGRPARLTAGSHRRGAPTEPDSRKFHGMHFVGVATLGQPLGHPCARTVYRKARVDVIVNGSNIPGIITPGSYGTGGTRAFWHVARADTVTVARGRRHATSRRVAASRLSGRDGRRHRA
jgi:hypothetical protein